MNKKPRYMILSMGLLVSSPALTQEAVLEEVVVTATKRSASLQDIPVTVSTLSAETIQDAGITNVVGVANLVPSMTVTTNSNPFNSAIRIRGIGTSQNDLSLEPSVGLFVDDVYFSRSGIGLAEMTDVERIEVLQGPQGTLYGKNTIAGAISVTTKPVDMEGYSGTLAGEVGNYDHRRVEGAVSGPLTDSIGFRLSGAWVERDGYIENGSGENLNSPDQWHLGGKLLFLPTDSLSIQINANYVSRDNTCCGADAVQTQQLEDELVAQGFPLVPNDAFDYKTRVDVDSRFKSTASVVSLVIDYEMDWASLTSITAANQFEYEQSTDPDRSELSTIYIIDDSDEGEAISQEFRLTSTDMDSWNYIVGVFLQAENLETDVLDFPGAAAIGDDFLSFLPPPAALIAAPGDYILGNNKYENRTAAVFGQAGWNITDSWVLNGGLRYTYEKKDADLFNQSISTAPGVPPAPPLLDNFATPIDEDFSRSKGDWTWMANAQYFFAGESMAFAGVSTGSKSGGFNGVNGPPESREFDDETAINYELGIKSQWLDNRLRVNATAFLEQFDNLQFLAQLPTGIGTFVSNAAQAESKGVDLEITAAPLPLLTLNLGVLYLDAEYTEGDLVGNEVVFAPTWSGNFGALVLIPLPVGGLYLRADYSYLGPHFTNPDYQPDESEQTRRNLDGRLGWRTESWDLSAWVKNATDQAYSNLTTTPLNFMGTEAEFLAPPRTYGATLRYNF